MMTKSRGKTTRFRFFVFISSTIVLHSNPWILYLLLFGNEC
ncbi:hypothetical protein FH5_00709 [Priestia endophytica]|nr:hypothetical protein FH5_00709 [Priestia endophytica]